MRIVQINAADKGGGAEKVAWDLFTAYRDRGHQSYLAVEQKRSTDPDVIEIPKTPVHRALSQSLFFPYRVLRRLPDKAYAVKWLRQKLQAIYPHPTLRTLFGQEDFDLPGSRRLLQLLPAQPDILHAHNLHPASYFDLRYLGQLSQQIPVALTLHDAWLLSGHCAHSFECDRWLHGCGHCPDLTIYPSMTRDATAFNWRQKQAIFQQSRLYVATPSAWLLDKVHRSMMMPAIQDSRVIHNGIDLTVFTPAPKQAVRDKLAIPQNAKVLLFAANGIRNNIWKDFETMRAALANVAARWQSTPLLFLALGENASSERIGEAEIVFVPYQKDAQRVAEYYQAADLYLHAANADTFPTTVLEALACGLPPIATRVGGIPEQVEDGISGFLVAKKNSAEMAERILLLLGDDEMRKRLGEQAVETARRKFDLKQQVDHYLAWYSEILAIHHRAISTVGN